MATETEQTITVASSNAATSQGSNYQVFVSFRGLDTREGFTNTLYHGLHDAGICVFLDDEALSVGERIDKSLEQAINNSKIYIPIFSRNYATSPWCLGELKQIMTFKSNGNKEILPIFLDVTPDDVKLKTPLYSNAIEELKREKELSDKLVNEWRDALVEVGKMKAWKGKDYKGHGHLTNVVVEEVMKKLKRKHKSVPPHVVGIDDQVSKVRKSLEINSGDVRFIQIHGMGGIGKTTLAMIVFNYLTSHFGKYCCFLQDIRRKSSPIDRLVEVQKKLLSEIGAPVGTETIDNVDDGMKRIADALYNKKVLIVLDDIDSTEQMNKLVEQVTFGSGSRILITTRNKDDLSRKHQIPKYEMELMSDDDALELFRRHAFYKDSPTDGYNDLSRQIVAATGKLPLALEVIGSLLHGRNSKRLWEETLAKLRKEPPMAMANYDAETSYEFEYDVLINFRGPDTRGEFVDSLYRGLVEAGIKVFRENKEFRVGDKIDGLLQQAIERCRIYISIFSPNYASSQSCLRELSQIMANTLKSEGNKEILPIFYNVEPEDVQLKTPLYRDAMFKWEKSSSNEEVDVWRKALMEAGATIGLEAKKHESHSQLIELVVKKVIQKLKKIQKSVIERLVGIDDQILSISKQLNINSGDVRLIKIYGMGGIGKTTLSKAVFDRVSSHFGKNCCFLQDVRAKWSRPDGIIEMQNELLAKIRHPAGTNDTEEMDHGVKRTGEAVSNEKVFIVLDDVDESEQVEKLVGKSTLCSGSRLIITTRDKDVLQRDSPKYQIVDYEMEMLSFNDALTLFSWHAFNGDSPLNDYYDLSSEIVSTIGGLPLTLEVSGSFLYGKTRDQWIKALQNFKEIPHEEVFARLKISYDALNVKQQQIFLDIACFLIGEDRTNAIHVWRDCELSPDIGVDVLVRMSLVKIVKNNTFWMHDQLRDLGREIVHQENSIYPGKRSRIWSCRDFLDVIGTKEINRHVKALSLDLHAQSSDDNVALSKEIGRFEHLRFLKLIRGTFAGDLANCLPNLRWIAWYAPPQICEWTNMYLKNIVVLEFTGIDLLDDSRLRGLIQRAGKLKVLSLKSCHDIITMPDFSGCPELERLTLEDCSNLSRIDASIGKLEYLIDLKINMCFCLEDLPEEIGGLVNLKHFFLQRCKVKKLPDSIWKLKSLRVLHFSSRLVSEDLWELPRAIDKLRNLEVLLVNSPNLQGQLPYGIGSLRYLRILNLSYTHVSKVPETIAKLRSLKRMELMACNNIRDLPKLPTSLTHLRVSSASLQKVPNLSNLTNLVELDLMIGEREETNSVPMSYGGSRGY